MGKSPSRHHTPHATPALTGIRVHISYSDTARAVLRDGPCWAAACTVTSLHLPSIPNTPAPGAAPKNVRPPRAPPHHSSLAPKRLPRQPRVSSPHALRWATSGHPHTKSTSLEPPRREAEIGRDWESLGEASFGEPALLLLSRRRGRGRCDGRSLALRGGVTCVPSAVVVAH